MELDKEELEATRKRKFWEDDKYKLYAPSSTHHKPSENVFHLTKQKSADEMFEELGCSKLSEVGNDIRITVYRNYRWNKAIQFNHLVERVMIIGKYQWFDMEELQAINEKCKELGWL